MSLTGRQLCNGLQTVVKKEISAKSKEHHHVRTELF